MKKILTIIKREYLTRVRTRAFIFGTVASPLLLLALTFLPMFFATRGGGERRITVLDQSGDPVLFESIKLKVESTVVAQAGGGGDPVDNARFTLTRMVVPPGADIDEIRRGYNQEIEANFSNAYIVLRPGVLDGAEPEYYSKNVSGFAVSGIERAMSSAIIERRLVRAGFDPNKVSEYIKPVDTKTFKVGPEGESQESGFQSFQVSFVMLFFIYITVLAYGVSVMRGVIEEKQSRIVEVIISSVKPTQLMLSKLIGIGLVGLTQYVIWVCSAILISTFGATLVGVNQTSLPQIPISLLIYFVVYFLLGYFLYATLYAMVGAMVSSEEEAQHVQFPVMMLIVTPMILFTMVLNNPNSASSITLSMIPFFAPSLMIMRIALAQPPLWQVLLSITLMVGTILLAVWVAARIYRVGILMYGKRPSLTELGRWLRYT